jgi:hypothetical protein
MGDSARKSNSRNSREAQCTLEKFICHFIPPDYRIFILAFPPIKDGSY